MKKPTPGRCAVVSIHEVTGPKGGQIHVLVLRCGSWLTRRLKPGARPPVTVFCIGCYVRTQITDKLAAELDAGRTTNGRPPH